MVYVSESGAFRMFGLASRLLLLAPALTYGLGAAFVAAAYGLGASPADPAAWRAFLTLAPIVREPVYLVAGLPGVGDAATLALFAALALAGGALVLTPQRTGRMRFIYAHLAFLMLVYSMGHSGVFTAGFPAVEGASGTRLDFRSLQLSDDGRCATRLCGARLRGQPFSDATPDEVADAARRDIDARLHLSLAEFA